MEAAPAARRNRQDMDGRRRQRLSSERAQHEVDRAGERVDAGALEGRLGEWLYAVCRNLCLDVLKKERPMATASEDGVLERASAEPGPDAVAERSEDTALDGCMDTETPVAGVSGSVLI